MKSISGVLLPQVGIGWPRSTKLASAVLPLLVGLTIGLLILALGPITLPIVIGLLVLPWLLQDPFRFFIWLIVTWPILALYVRIPLPAGIPDLTYDRALVLLLLCVIILGALLSRRRLVKVTPMDILVMMYVVAQLAARVFVVSFGGMGKPDLNGLLDIVLVPVVMYWIAKNLLVSRAHLKWFLYALLIGSLLICLSGLYEQAVGAQERLFTVSTRLGGSENLQVRGWQDVRGGRAAGVLGNPAIYGATLGMGILAGICCLADAKRGRRHVVLVATIGVLLYGVLASYTRSAWISVLLVLFIAQFLVDGLWKKTLPICMLGLLLLILMWDSLSGSSAVVSRALTTASVTPRLALTQLGRERFMERPFFGWGSGALDLFGLEYVGAVSHSMFLTFLVDGGLVLFLSFLVLSVYLLARAARVYGTTERNSFDRNVLVAMTGCILIFLLSGLSLELRYFGYFNALFWICVGVVDRL